MQPTSSRDFQKAAAQRLIAAETLFREKLNLDAKYIGGYTVECSLKALILELTPDSDKLDKLKKITSGREMHSPEKLLGLLRDVGKLRGLGVALPVVLSKRLRTRHFQDWTTDLRYETGRRDTGETTAFLRTAKAIYEWVESQLP